MNCITISGFVTKDPIIGMTKAGSKVVNFCVAVKEDRPNTLGNYATYYFRISCWGSVADFVQRHIQKDNYVMVQGRVVQSKYLDRFTGKTVYGFEIHADHVENGLVSGGRKAETKRASLNHLTEYVDAEENSDSQYT